MHLHVRIRYMYRVILNLYITSILVITNIFASNVSLFLRDAIANILCQCSLKFNLTMFSTANVSHYIYGNNETDKMVMIAWTLSYFNLASSKQLILTCIRCLVPFIITIFNMLLSLFLKVKQPAFDKVSFSNLSMSTNVWIVFKCCLDKYKTNRDSPDNWLERLDIDPAPFGDMWSSKSLD